jgi:thiol-disulfide isomerase/thioredoxin
MEKTKSIFLFTILITLSLFSSCQVEVENENLVEDTIAEAAVEETSGPEQITGLEDSDTEDSESATDIELVEATEVESTTYSLWGKTELTSLLTDDTFTINQLLDQNKPILLETFAVWCPTCTSQQQEIQALHDERGDAFISISLDVDPNEDAQTIIDHANSHGFDWNYAISPTNLTQDLIDEFGITIASAPQAPVILICQDGNAELLDNGLKKMDELKEALDSCS